MRGIERLVAAIVLAGAVAGAAAFGHLLGKDSAPAPIAGAVLDTPAAAPRISVQAALLPKPAVEKAPAIHRASPLPSRISFISAPVAKRATPAVSNAAVQAKPKPAVKPVSVAPAAPKPKPAAPTTPATPPAPAPTPPAPTPQAPAAPAPAAPAPAPTTTPTQDLLSANTTPPATTTTDTSSSDDNGTKTYSRNGVTVSITPPHVSVQVTPSGVSVQVTQPQVSVQATPPVQTPTVDANALARAAAGWTGQSWGRDH